MTIYLADTSAWHRSVHPQVSARWDALLGEDAIATCDQVRLEVLFSARSRRDYIAIADDLDAIPHLPCGRAQFARALEVQRMLAGLGGLHHRSVNVADLVIAASAEAGGATVWHYDEDFERVAEITGQPAEWIASRGSL